MPRRRRPRSARCRPCRRGRGRPAGCRPRPDRRDSSSPPRRPASGGSGPRRPARRTKPAASAPATSCSAWRPAGTPSRKSAASSAGVDLVPLPRLRPVRARSTPRPARLGQRPGRLQAGQDAHVVLGRGPPKTTATLAVLTFNGCAPRLGGIPDAWARSGGRSRVVVGQVVLVQHDVARPEVLADPRRRPAGAVPHHDRGTAARRRPPRRRAAGRARLVRPTTTRSVATAAAAAAKRAFSSSWRGPSSTIPGVTTTAPVGRRPHSRRERRPGPAAAPAGLAL